MKKNFLLIIGSIIVIIIIGIIMYYTTDESQNERDIFINNYLTDIGYNYDEETGMFEKTTTNNTLDDFYKSVEKKENTNYQNYYFTIDSYSFIELNMSYKNGVTETYTINSDLKNNTIIYNYEITKKDSSAIIEGEYKEEESNPFTCNIVSLKKLNNSGKETYCNTAKKLTIDFINEENELLGNNEFQSIINIPKKEIIIKES